MAEIKSSYVRESNFISFSGMSQCQKCPYSYRIHYHGLEVDGLREFPIRQTSHQLVIGQVAHTVIQYGLNNNYKPPTLDYCFGELNQVERLLVEDEERRLEVEQAYRKLIELTLPAVKQYMEENHLELVAVEHGLRNRLIGDFNQGEVDSFKGSIDLVLKSTKGDRYRLVDIKCAGYPYIKSIKGESWLQYQLVFYKHFYSLNQQIPLSNIEQEFWFVQKPSFKFEAYQITAGEKKIGNAISKMTKIVSQVNNNRFPKNKTSCAWCDLRHTKFCS